MLKLVQKPKRNPVPHEEIFFMSKNKRPQITWKLGDLNDRREQLKDRKSVEEAQAAIDELIFK